MKPETEMQKSLTEPHYNVFETQKPNVLRYYKVSKHYECLPERNLQNNHRLNSCKLWASVTAIVVMTLVAVGLLAHEKDLTRASVTRARPPAAPLAPPTSPCNVLVCYYSLPGPEQGDQSPLLPQDINPYLCTHINIAFAQVKNKTIYLDDYQLRALPEVVRLKVVNPSLKIILSVGGGGQGAGFSDMVANHSSRKTFIKSIKYILGNYTLDGVDLDWEFPGIHSSHGAVGKREKQHFSQLLREIRAEFTRERRSYILSAAVAAPETIVDISYDVDQLDLYVDYVNIMTYDFHYYSKYTPFTGLNSPLFARSSEQLYMATLNINYTVNMYVQKGLSKDKIVVGIPTYGHTFTLVNADNTAIGSPASGFGSLGSLGFVNYPDVCIFEKKFKDEVVVKEDNFGKVPYLYKDKEWVSYERPQSVAEKAAYIKKSGLKGAMIYSLNADDYTGLCKEKLENEIKFPLVQAAKITLTESSDSSDHK